MGCILEFFAEFVVELVLEGYLALMNLIVPSARITKKQRYAAKVVATVIAIVLLISLVVGLILMVESDSPYKKAGKTVFFMSAAIMLLQIGAGIVLKATGKGKYENVPPVPPMSELCDIMYEKQKEGRLDTVCKTVYSLDRTMRYLVLKNCCGLYTYALEVITPFDEDEWQWIYTADKNALPAEWRDYYPGASVSFFQSAEDAVAALKNETEYRTYF